MLSKAAISQPKSRAYAPVTPLLGNIRHEVGNQLDSVVQCSSRPWNVASLAARIRCQGPTMARCTKSPRSWISGLAIVLTALVCLFAFSQLSPLLTFGVGLFSFIALILLFWFSGGNKKN